MRKSLRIATLLILTCAVLTVSVSADMGPKPQLTVRVENAPEELYYLDLLAEGEYEGYSYGDGRSPYSGLDWSYSDGESAALDEGLLDTLRAAVPDGWHACTAEGTGGAPMWGQLYAESTDNAGIPSTPLATWASPRPTASLSPRRAERLGFLTLIPVKSSSPPSPWTGPTSLSPYRSSGQAMRCNFFAPACPRC